MDVPGVHYGQQDQFSAVSDFEGLNILCFIRTAFFSGYCMRDAGSVFAIGY